MVNLSGAALFEDSHWDVPKIWQALIASGQNAAYVIESEGQLQGFVVYRTAPYIGIDEKSCGYIPFIAVAPWNRAAAGTKAIFKGIGSLLVGFASVSSVDIHHSGALELGSLPGAEGFYTKIGFNRTGRKTPPPDQLNEFRLEESAALVLARGLLSKRLL